MAASRQELEAILSHPLSTLEQKAEAEKLLSTDSKPTSEFQLYCDLAGFDSTAEILARHARGWADPVQRHKSFEMLRESWKTNSRGMKSFSLERENLPQERRGYDK